MKRKKTNLAAMALSALLCFTAGAVTDPTYKVTVKEGTEDAANWTIDPAAATNTGVKAGTTITAAYGGTKKVKSVKAKKKAEAGYAATEYNEASWDGTKVVLTKKTAASTPVAVADANTAVTWGAGWYTVSGNVTINGKVTLTADTYLILQDGATLTINGQLNCNANSKSLYIYGQGKGDGKLNVSYAYGTVIKGGENKNLEIHGGEITAEGTGFSDALWFGHIKVFSGKLTANAPLSEGIYFYNSIKVYGGEVEGSGDDYGIESANYGSTLTVYDGKVKGTGSGGGFKSDIQSGTEGIKFYFSDDGNTWDAGTYYGTATYAPNKRYGKAE